jgi:hypothetical protein
MGVTRRELFAMALGAPVLGSLSCTDEDSGDGWDRGTLRHLLATASHRAFNIKVSFREPLAVAPILLVGSREIAGERQDSFGRFWAFRVSGLASDREFQLELRRSGSTGRASSEALCEPWPLRTFPAPGDRPERLRIASFTCAGGPNLPIPGRLFEPFKPADYRRRLFDLMLEEKPDLVVANGDHVYFDLPAMARLRENPMIKALSGFLRGINAAFDPNQPVLGSANEAALTTVGDDQIASIYGVRFRSTPVFFVTDDHDYFDNDDATIERVTFPPDAFHRSLRNTLQKLYFPEFIMERDPGLGFPGISSRDGVRLSTHFGEVRVGDLFSGLLYDCGGYMSLGAEAGLFPTRVEEWLISRTRIEDTRHLIHFPSHPLGSTAGKWREWYRDLLTSSGAIVAEVLRDEDGNKFMWQEGWWNQHQRLVHALTSQKNRTPVMVSGDLHTLGATRIERSGNLDLQDNPLYSVLSGPAGVGEVGWPSRARGVQARTPTDLITTELFPNEERNGFTILEIDRGQMQSDLYRCPEGYVSAQQLSVETVARLKLS